MFGKLKSIFKKAEKDIEEKVEDKIEEIPSEVPAEEPVEPIEEIEEPKPKEVTEEVSEIKNKEKKSEKPKIQKESKELPTYYTAAEKTRSEDVKERVKVGFGTKLRTSLGRKARLSESEIEDITWNLQMALMQSDVALEVAERITEELKEKLAITEFSDPKTQVKEVFRQVLINILETGGTLDFIEFIKSHEKPVKVVFFGINGCGKTTTISKVAHKLKEEGLSVVVAAGDTFRAGAQEQLGVHADRLGIKMVHHQRGGDAAAVIFDAIKHATAAGIDVVLADTSGRMQSDVDLMGEMEKIVRVNKPDLKVFVGDSLTGNDAIEQAREFNDKVGIDASILAKFDASKGGASLSVAHITKKPVIFLGVGQNYGDLQKFDAADFVDEII
jgi:fused signal recognition particle receptor